MTMIREYRCEHCRTRYGHYISGPKCREQLSTGTHCGTCNGVIQAALATVPIKFVQEYVPTTEVTLEQLLEWERDRENFLDAEHAAKVARNPTGFVFPSRPRRVEMYLMDQEDPDNRNRRGRVAGQGEFAGKVYLYSYWTKKGPTEIQWLAEKNVETGDLLPWKDLSR